MTTPNAESVRLHEAGRRRARERAEVVDALRYPNMDSLIIAVLERWGVEPHNAQKPVWGMARSAVLAVLNCAQIDDSGAES